MQRQKRKSLLYCGWRQDDSKGQERGVVLVVFVFVFVFVHGKHFEK